MADETLQDRLKRIKAIEREQFANDYPDLVRDPGPEALTAILEASDIHVTQHVLACFEMITLVNTTH